MNRLARLLAIGCIALLLGARVATQVQMPHSQRAQDAMQRVTPTLRADLAAQGLSWGTPVFMRVYKDPGTLEVWLQNSRNQFQLFRRYPVCYFSGQPGPKVREGDLQSPEGFYFVTPARLNPFSRFHLSFNLGFPNAYDRHHGRTGSALMVHGDCVSIGCYAMTDAGIEEIYTLAHAALSHGQPFFRVHVFPFEMTAANVDAQHASRWHAFWQNLKVGHDHFETHRRPPNVRLRDGRYVFDPD